MNQANTYNNSTDTINMYSTNKHSTDEHSTYKQSTNMSNKK